MAKIMASEKSSTALNCVVQPITMKMQKILLKTSFEDRFAPDRIRSGDEFTSVASGLALCAAEDPPKSD